MAANQNNDVGSNQPPVSTFIPIMGHAHEAVKEFYQTYQRDFQISIKQPVTIIKTKKYLDLFKAINSSNNKNILIFSHGNQVGGLTSFRFGNVNNPNLNSIQGFFWILHYCAVNSLYRQYKSSLNPDDWLKILKLVIKNHYLETPEKVLKEINEFNINNSDEYTRIIMKEISPYKEMKEETDSDKKIKAKKLKELIKGKGTKLDGWDDKICAFQHKTLTERLKVNIPTINEYIKEIKTLQNIKLINLHIRGCRIGCDSSILIIYSIFFNVQNIDATKTRVHVGKFGYYLYHKEKVLRKRITNAAINRFGEQTSPQNWLGKGSYNRISTPDDEPELCGIYEPGERIPQRKYSAQYYNPSKEDKNKNELFFVWSQTGGRIIAEDFEIIKDWVNEKFGTMNKTIETKLRNSKLIPIYCLETFPYVFPQDAEFERYLTRGTSDYRNFLNPYI